MIFPLVGNDKIKSAIVAALAEHRLPHAILIEGEQGLGKHTLAYFLARGALCEMFEAPCDNCKNCNLALSNNHPDITVVKPEEDKKNISVAQIRELRTEIFIKPHTAKGRVFIIDKAQTLNPQSQNALLKILEEPPQNTTFILISDNKASLLETVISRCTVLSLSTPEVEVATEYILQKTDFEKQEIINALENTKNNIGNALSLLNGAKTSKTLEAAKAYLDFFSNGDGWGMLNVTVPFEKSRVEAESFVKDLKQEIAIKLKSNPKSVLAKALSIFYSELGLIESTLLTNINLNLFFSALTCKAEVIYKKWRSL